MIFYLFPVLICILATIFFHLFFINQTPQTKRFWIKVDYWWVSLGFISVIGATYSFKKEYSTARQPWHRQTIESYYNFYLDKLSHLGDYYLNPNGFDYEKFEDKTQSEKYKQAGLFFQNMHQNAKDFKYNIANQYSYNYLDTLNLKYKSFIDTINNAYIVSSSEGLNYFMKTMLETKRTIDKLESQIQKTSLDWVLLFLSPFLFSIAIALRLTKVTANLKENK
jgi:hypothetical protein